jgi:putative hydrolase of HD superfamily
VQHPLRPPVGPLRYRDAVSDEARDITAFLYEIGQLKRYPRTGWLTAGVPGPESVADHSYRASVVAAVIATMEGADPQRAAFLALWHDSQETRTTDLSHLTKKYVTPASNAEVTSAQVARLPGVLAGVISAAVAEYEARQTPESRCARDADKIELLLQAREYTDQGHPGLRPFIDSALATLQTAAARELAAEAQRQGFLDWVERAMDPSTPRDSTPSGSIMPEDAAPGDSTPSGSTALGGTALGGTGLRDTTARGDA